ncbi:MAG: hypothetical protein ACLGJC_14720 [Alphaproteobacteria bacterium]
MEILRFGPFVALQFRRLELDQALPVMIVILGEQRSMELCGAGTPVSAMYWL